MRQHIYTAVILIALVTVLTGCAGGTSATSVTPASPTGGVASTAGAPPPRAGVRLPPLGASTAPLPGAATAIGTAAPLSAPGQYRYKKSAARTPACAQAGRAIALPRSFPAAFPFPPGTAITSNTPYGGDPTKPVIGGVIPSSSFAAVVTFFVTQLPQAGFRLRDGDSEAAEAESVFVGHGYIGRWRVRGLDTCPSAAILLVFAERYPLPTR